jgi:hypothetical protein
MLPHHHVGGELVDHDLIGREVARRLAVHEHRLQRPIEWGASNDLAAGHGEVAVELQPQAPRALALQREVHAPIPRLQAYIGSAAAFKRPIGETATSDTFAFCQLPRLSGLSGVPCKDGGLQWVRVPPGNWSFQPEAVGAVRGGNEFR